VYSIPFPVSFVNLSSRLGFANLDLLAIVNFGCLGTLDFYGKLVIMTSVPLALAACLLAKHRCFTKGAQKTKDDVQNKCVAWFLKLTYLVFPGVSTLVLQSYTCMEFDSGERFLKADLSISCDAPERLAWFVYAVVMTVVYPIGITLLYAVLLWRQKHNICPIPFSSPTGISQWRCIRGIPILPKKLQSDQEEQAILDQRKGALQSNQDLRNIQFLFKEYEPYYWWFEIFQCIQRLMLTGGSVMFMEGSSSQVVCGMLVALLSIHVNSICQPFIQDDDDVLALSAVWGIFFTLLGGLLLKLNLGDADGLDLGHGTGIFLVSVNTMVILIAVGTVVFQFLKFKEGRRQASQRQTLKSVELEQIHSVPDGGNGHDYQLME
jgi:hypothetical protein